MGILNHIYARPTDPLSARRVSANGPAASFSGLIWCFFANHPIDTISAINQSPCTEPQLARATHSSPPPPPTTNRIEHYARSLEKL